MIKNRPARHETLDHYIGLPEPPYKVDIDKIPDLIKLMVLTLRHVEPLSTDLLKDIDPVIDDFPHADEKAFYERHNAQFQLVFLVVNSIFGKDEGDFRTLYPYSLSLVPATKRDKVDESGYALVEAFGDGGVLNKEWAYLRLDPFNGDWGMFSTLDVVVPMGKSNGHTDELGLIHDYFFLRKDVDLKSIAQPTIGLEEARQKRFLRHRAKLLYTPFRGTDARQVWGVENGLEMFVLQEMMHRNFPWPTIQAQIYDDGSIYPSLYHAWSDREIMSDENFIAEVDFCFQEQKVVVFCDGAMHQRSRVKDRDAKINDRLRALGFEVVRIPSRDILRDVRSAIEPLSKYFQ